MSEEMFIGRTLLPKTLLANIVLTFLRIANRAETWEHCVDRLQMALSMNFSFIYGYSSCADYFLYQRLHILQEYNQLALALCIHIVKINLKPKKSP